MQEMGDEDAVVVLGIGGDAAGAGGWALGGVDGRLSEYGEVEGITERAGRGSQETCDWSVHVFWCCCCPAAAVGVWIVVF